MGPNNPLFTDNTTFINPFGMMFTLLMGILVIALPRKHAIFPILALVCYMTMGMRILILGLNFTMIRILLIFCWARLIARGELRRMKFSPIDKAVIWFCVISIVTHTCLLGADGLKYKLGQAYDAIGFYFFFRILVASWNDLFQLWKGLAILLVPLALEMVNEKVTGVNMFAMFGGVEKEVIVREGTLRAQGPFGHPILAGTFGATLMPFMVGLLMQRGRNLWAAAGLCAATVITIAAGSSGPVMAYAFGVLLIAIWFVRGKVLVIRRTALVVLVALHFAMKAPVWYLLARFSVVDGSTGYHRAILIDMCIANFKSWWLIGTTEYGNWGYYLFDRTNHYVCLATDGGLITLILFIAALVLCFRAIGKIVKRADARKRRNESIAGWMMGAALGVHCLGFISVTYFDQNMISWYLLLALIASASGFLPGGELRRSKMGAKLQSPQLMGSLVHG